VLHRLGKALQENAPSLRIPHRVLPDEGGFGDACTIASSGLLDENKERSDYLFEAPLDKAKLKEVEDRANALIAEGLDIRTYRDPVDPDVLRWEMSPWKMDCCGTHPKNTKEIGHITISRGKKPGKGRERIEISLS